MTFGDWGYRSDIRSLEFALLEGRTMGGCRLLLSFIFKIYVKIKACWVSTTVNGIRILSQTVGRKGWDEMRRIH